MFVNLRPIEQPDGRVDGLIDSHATTRSDVAGIVTWLQDIEAHLTILSADVAVLPRHTDIPQPTPPPVQVDLQAALEPIYMKLKMLDEAVNNRDKQQVIDQLAAYWAEKHPDCFIEYADGRRVFRHELLEYKHDTLLTELFNRKPPEAPSAPVVEAAPAPTTKTAPTWPMWLAIGALFVMELLKHV